MYPGVVRLPYEPIYAIAPPADHGRLLLEWWDHDGRAYHLVQIAPHAWACVAVLAIGDC